MNQPTLTKELFLQVDYKLLSDNRFTSNQKIIISYLKSYQREDKFFFDTQDNLSGILGIPLRTLKKDIKQLLALGIIFFKPKCLIDGKRQYKNRKAIILVDGDNPLPIRYEAAEATLSIQKPIRKLLEDSNMEQVSKEVLFDYLKENGQHLKLVKQMLINNEIIDGTITTLPQLIEKIATV